MPTGAVGGNGAHAQKVVVLVCKSEEGFATAHYKLTVAKIALLVGQVIQKLKCATIQVAQVR